MLRLFLFDRFIEVFVFFASFFFFCYGIMDPVSVALLCIATVNSITLLSVALVEYCTE